MPIVYTPGYTWSDLVASHPRRLPFLLHRHTDPKTRQPYLHVGSEGLLGGGKKESVGWKPPRVDQPKRSSREPSLKKVVLNDPEEQKALDQYEKAKSNLEVLQVVLQEASRCSKKEDRADSIGRAQSLVDKIQRQLSKAESYCDTDWLRAQLKQHRIELDRLAGSIISTPF